MSMSLSCIHLMDCASIDRWIWIRLNNFRCLSKSRRDFRTHSRISWTSLERKLSACDARIPSTRHWEVIFSHLGTEFDVDCELLSVRPRPFTRPNDTKWNEIEKCYNFENKERKTNMFELWEFFAMRCRSLDDATHVVIFSHISS